MTLDAYSFDFTTHAAVAVRSNDDNDTGMTKFALGSSNPHQWSGNDLAKLAPSVPAFAVTNKADYDAGDGFGAPPNLQGMGEAAVSHDNSNIYGEQLLAKLAPSSLEWWLQDAVKARTFLTLMRDKASRTGRLNPATSDMGTDAEPKFSFVDGDLDLNGNNEGGTGLLIVAGKYTQSGSSHFHGIIIALGKGSVERKGTPDIAGALVIARIDPVIDKTTGAITSSDTFLSPSLDVDGGGNSLVGYNSDWVRKAMQSLGPRPVGIVEK
jgi:hypothetical protein